MRRDLLVACIVAICVVLASSYRQAGGASRVFDAFYGGSSDSSEWVPPGRLRFNREHDAIWANIQSVKVESQNFNSCSFVSGITWRTMADILERKFYRNDFPKDRDLQLLHWQLVKSIPIEVIDGVLINFMQTTRFWYDNDLYIIALKVINANSTIDKKQYLMTFRMLLFRNGLMFGKVVEFTVFCDFARELPSYKYTRVGIIGVVHQQHIKRV